MCCRIYVPTSTEFRTTNWQSVRKSSLAESKLEADHVTRWNAAWKLSGDGCYIKHGMLVIYRENEKNGSADSIVVPGGL